MVLMNRLRHSRPNYLFAKSDSIPGSGPGERQNQVQVPFLVGSDLEGGTFVFSLSSDSIPGCGLEERHTQVQVSVAAQQPQQPYYQPPPRQFYQPHHQQQQQHQHQSSGRESQQPCGRCDQHGHVAARSTTPIPAFHHTLPPDGDYADAANPCFTRTAWSSAEDRAAVSHHAPQGDVGTFRVNADNCSYSVCTVHSLIKRVPLIRMCGSPTVVHPVKCRDCSSMYKIRPPPSGREIIVIVDGRSLRVHGVRSVDMTLHGHTDEGHTVFDVSYVPGLGFNLHSLHTIQRIHSIGTGITFPRDTKGSCMLLISLLPGSIKGKVR